MNRNYNLTENGKVVVHSLDSHKKIDDFELDNDPAVNRVIARIDVKDKIIVEARCDRTTKAIQGVIKLLHRVEEDLKIG